MDLDYSPPIGQPQNSDESFLFEKEILFRNSLRIFGYNKASVIYFRMSAVNKTDNYKVAAAKGIWPISIAKKKLAGKRRLEFWGFHTGSPANHIPCVPRVNIIFPEQRFFN